MKYMRLLITTGVLFLGAIPAYADSAQAGPAKSSGYSADQNGDFRIDLSELLRVIQFFNSSGYHCAAGTEDGFDPGPGDQSCSPHDCDYNTQNWDINMSELLRLIQFFNMNGFYNCAESEDGFCPGSPPNIVFLLLDTLRADCIGGTRNSIPIMPFLSEFAQGGALFTRATSPGSWTRPAMASLFTGLYAEALWGAEDSPSEERFMLWPEYETITEWLVNAAGYDPWAYQTNGWCTEYFGYTQGFPEGRFPFSDNAPAAEVTDGVLANIDSWQEPFFTFAQYLDPHGPSTPPAEYAEAFGEPPDATATDLNYLLPGNWTEYITDVYLAWFSSLPLGITPLTENGEETMRYRYDAETRYLDAELERLITAIQTRFPNTIFVILADHGEEMMDRALIGHGHTLYEEQSRVPLIVQGPGITPQVVDVPVEPVGLMPTLANLLNLVPNPQWQGRDFFDLTGSESIFCYTWADFGGVITEASSVAVGNLKYIEHNHYAQPMLFDLATDPGELTDLAASRPADVANMAALLAAHKTAVIP
jgi:arylsulfatase A-like enzyme